MTISNNKEISKKQEGQLVKNKDIVKKNMRGSYKSNKINTKQFPSYFLIKKKQDGKLYFNKKVHHRRIKEIGQKQEGELQHNKYSSNVSPSPPPPPPPLPPPP